MSRAGLTLMPYVAVAVRADGGPVAVDAQGFLATGALDNVVRLWDGKGQLVHELRGHEKPTMADGGVLAVALMENGGRVLSGGRDGRLLAFLRDASAARAADKERHVNETVEREQRLKQLEGEVGRLRVAAADRAARRKSSNESVRRAAKNNQVPVREFDKENSSTSA